MGQVIPVLGGVILQLHGQELHDVGQALRACTAPTICNIKNMKLVNTVDTDGSDHVGSITFTLRHNIVASRARQD